MESINLLRNLSLYNNTNFLMRWLLGFRDLLKFKRSKHIMYSIV